MNACARHLAATALALLCVAPGLAAQEHPVLRSAARLAAEGHTDSARVLVNGVLASTRTGEPAWVEALYWRARFATQVEAADRDLRRIVVEFPGSPWADDALLQLSQLAMAAGNPAAAVEYVARLRSDYPASALRAKAALWGGRAAFDVGEPRSACALLDSASIEGAGDIEFANQVRFYRSRCTAEVLAAPPRGDTVRPSRDTAATAPVPAPPAAAPTARPAARFDVQVAAVTSDREARALVQRLKSRRVTARIVVGGGMRRLRVGPFPSLQAADSAATALRRIAGGRPFPVRVP